MKRLMTLCVFALLVNGQIAADARNVAKGFAQGAGYSAVAGLSGATIGAVTAMCLDKPEPLLLAPIGFLAGSAFGVYEGTQKWHEKRDKALGLIAGSFALPVGAAAAGLCLVTGTLGAVFGEILKAWR